MRALLIAFCVAGAAFAHDPTPPDNTPPPPSNGWVRYSVQYDPSQDPEPEIVSYISAPLPNGGVGACGLLLCNPLAGEIGGPKTRIQHITPDTYSSWMFMSTDYIPTVDLEYGPMGWLFIDPEEIVYNDYAATPSSTASGFAYYNRNFLFTDPSTAGLELYVQAAAWDPTETEPHQWSNGARLTIW